MDYLARGYRGFQVARGKTVEGDVWYVASKNSNQEVSHPDLRWLDIEMFGQTDGQEDAYIFDMYVDPGKRNHFVALDLLRESLFALKDRGITKAYLYILADDVPASSVIGPFRFDVEKRLEIGRVLSYRFVRTRRRSATGMLRSRKPYPGQRKAKAKEGPRE